MTAHAGRKVEGQQPMAAVTQPQAISPQSWPISQPYDVVFYRSRGPKSRVNVTFQHAFDFDAFKSSRKFTHCALVGSELTAVEAYPRAVKGYYTDMLHPGGVRFVPVIDLCYDSKKRYRDFMVLRCPDLRSPDTFFGAESMMSAWRYIESKYSLRRFVGFGRGPKDNQNAKQIKEWLSCSDLVLKILADSGRFGMKFRERTTPSGLVAQLKMRGWQDVTADYAPERFEIKSRQYMQRFGLSGANRAGVDIFALKMAWNLGTFGQSIQRQQYMVEEYINRRLSNLWHHDPEAKSFLERFTADHAMGVLKQIRSMRADDFGDHIDPLLAELSQKRHFLK